MSTAQPPSPLVLGAAGVVGGLVEVSRQVLIGGEEFTPPRLGVAALTPSEVGGEVFDMDLDARPIGGELVQGHASFLAHQDGLVAICSQSDLDGLLVRRVVVLDDEE